MVAVTYRSSIGSRLFDVANYVFVLVFSVTCLIPFLYMFAIATSSYTAIATNEVFLLPVDFHIDTFRSVFTSVPLMLRAYWNSILYTATSVVLVLAVSSMGGFVLNLKHLQFKRFFTMMLLVMMFFSGGLIPVFLWIRALGLYNTIWAIVLPTAVAPWNIFIFRVYTRSNVPESLYESVYLDGGGDLTVYARIVLPLIKPALATFGLFAAVAMWNSFTPALIYLEDPEKFPLTLFLRRMVMLNDLGRGFGEVMEEREQRELFGNLDLHLFGKGYRKSAGMVMTFLTVLPMIVIYPFAQRYFVKGVVIGSIKG